MCSMKPNASVKYQLPTFDEGLRAAYVADRMREIGLDDICVDDIHNVTGYR